MLSVCRDAHGTLQAGLEWGLVDDFGTWAPYGRYVWVNQLEVNPNMNWRPWVRERSSNASNVVGRSVVKRLPTLISNGRPRRLVAQTWISR